MPSQSRSMTSGDMVIDNRGVILDLGPKEKEFQKWWAYWSEKTGLSKDPNPDLHFYDNRKAFLAGIEPKIDPTDGKYHWDSGYKYRKEVEGVDHPNRYVDGKDTTAIGDYKPYSGPASSIIDKSEQDPGEYIDFNKEKTEWGRPEITEEQLQLASEKAVNKKPTDKNLLAWMQKRGLVGEIYSTERIRPPKDPAQVAEFGEEAAGYGVPGQKVKETLVRKPINLIDEQRKNLRSWMETRGMVDPSPPPPSPQEMQMRESHARDIEQYVNKNIIGPMRQEPLLLLNSETLTAWKDFKRVPPFNPPGPKTKRAFAQLVDITKAKYKSDELNPEVLSSALEFVPRTVGNIIGKDWSFDALLDAIEPGASAEFHETERKKLKGQLGYDPYQRNIVSDKKGRVSYASSGVELGNTMARILPMAMSYGVLGTGATAAGTALAGGRAIPAVNALIRTLTLGSYAGLSQIPSEGPNTFAKRVEQVPGYLLIFGLMEGAAMGAKFLADLANFNKQYSTIRMTEKIKVGNEWVDSDLVHKGSIFTKTGKPGGYGPGMKIGTEPGFPGVDITEQTMKDLHAKMLRSAAGEQVTYTLEEQAAGHYINQGEGWKQWLQSMGAKWTQGFPRKPALRDITKGVPDPFVFDIDAINAARTARTASATHQTPIYEQPAGGLPPGPPRQIGTAERPVPPVEVTPTATPATPVAKPIAGPLGLPSPIAEPAPVIETVKGQRLPENATERRAIQVALDDFKGKTPASPEDLEVARIALEHASMAGIGNAKLLNIHTRLGKETYKYIALFDLRDLKKWNDKLTEAVVNQKVFPEIQDRLEKFNTTANPIGWVAGRHGGDELYLLGNDPVKLEADVRAINTDLKKVIVGGEPIKLDYGLGEDYDLAYYNLKKMKGAAKIADAESIGTTRSEEVIEHFTQEENIEKIYDKGFNSKLPPNFGIRATDRPRGSQGFDTSQKMGRGILYFTKDPIRYATADIFVGKGMGNKDYEYKNKETGVVTRIPMALQSTPLKSIKANMKPDARILILDSVDKYIKFKGNAELSGSLSEVVNKAKKLGYDILEIKHVPGQWEREGFTDRQGNKDLYASTTGGAGKNDFFVFNRKAIHIPEAGIYKNRKLFESLAAASRKRGRVGWTKGQSALYDAIFKITHGTGISPEIVPSTGLVREEFKVNIPKFMWNKKSPHSVDTVSEELKALGFKIDDENDIYSLFSKTKLEKPSQMTDEGEDIVPIKDDEIKNLVSQRLEPLMKPGEELDDFYDRMKKEAMESGFGEDYVDYIDGQMSLHEKGVQAKIQDKMTEAVGEKPTPEGEEDFSLNTATPSIRSISDFLAQKKYPDDISFPPSGDLRDDLFNLVDYGASLQFIFNKIIKDTSLSKGEFNGAIDFVARKMDVIEIIVDREKIKPVLAMMSRDGMRYIDATEWMIELSWIDRGLETGMGDISQKELVEVEKLYLPGQLDPDNNYILEKPIPPITLDQTVPITFDKGVEIIDLMADAGVSRKSMDYWLDNQALEKSTELNDRELLKFHIDRSAELTRPISVKKNRVMTPDAQNLAEQRAIELEMNTLRDSIDSFFLTQMKAPLGQVDAVRKVYKPGETMTRKLKLKVDLRQLLNKTTVSLYGDRVGNKGIQEFSTNSIDAAVQALLKDQIKLGKIKLLFKDGIIHIEDNGIGMDENQVDDFFLTIYGSGKRDVQSIGSFGIGSALAFAMHPKSVFSMDTQDVHFDTAIVSKESAPTAIVQRQGSKLTVQWPKEKRDDQHFYQELVDDRGLYFVLLNSIPKDKIEFTWRNLDEPGGGKDRLHEDLLTRIKGMPKPMAGDANTKATATYYTQNEIMKLDEFWETELNLSEYEAPSRKLDATVIIRMVHPGMPDVKIIQSFAKKYDLPNYHGTLVIDLLTDVKAGESGYPLKQDRETLIQELADQVTAIREPLAKDPARAAREAVVPKITRVKDSPEWTKAITKSNSDPSVVKLKKIINSIRDSRGNPMATLDLENVPLHIDPGYTGPTDVTVDHIKHLIIYNAVLDIASDLGGVVFPYLYPMLSETIVGQVVESQRNTATGAIGYNYQIANLSLNGDPIQVAQGLVRLAGHELAHAYGRDLTAEHEQAMDRIIDSVMPKIFDIYRLAIAYTGNEINSSEIGKVVNVLLPNGTHATVPKSVAATSTKEQLQFNFDKKEDKGYDQSLATKGKVLPVIRPGDEVGRIERRKQIQRDARLNRPGVPVETGGRTEQPTPSATSKVNQRRMGLQQDRERRRLQGQGIKPTEDFKLIEDPNKPFSLVNPEPPPPPFKPEAPYAPQEGERAPQGILPMPDASPLFQGTEQVKPTAPVKNITWRSQQEIVDAVTNLTTGGNFPNHWRSNTEDEVLDNRQNLIVYTLQNYDPSKGPLQNFINKAKKFFFKGNWPSSPGSTARIERETKVEGLPVGMDSTTLQLPESSDVFAVESQPQGKNPELEYVNPEAKEATYATQDANIEKTFRDVARSAAVDTSQGNLFGPSSMGPSALEERYFQILNRRLNMDPETFDSIGKATGISGSLANELYNMLLPKLMDSPGIMEMLNRETIELNLGLPFTKVELIQLARMINTWLDPTRGGGRVIDKKNDQRIGFAHARIFDQIIDIGKFTKWVNKQPAGTKEHVLELYTGKISGSGPQDIMNSSLPEEIKKVLMSLRRRSDMLSNLVKIYGAAPDDAQLAIDHNVGQYIERKFRIWEDKRWNPTKQQRAAFKHELMTQPRGVFQAPMSDAEAEAWINSDLAFHRGRNFSQKSAANKRINQDAYEKKLYLSPAWREYAGEIRDPAWLMLDTVTRQAYTVANARMLTEIADHFGEYTPKNLTGMWTKNPIQAKSVQTPDGRFETWTKSQLADNASWGKLRGAYVSPHLKEYLDREILPMRSELEKLISKFILNPFKASKTIYSFPAHMRNLFGDGIMAIAYGISPLNPMNAKFFAESLAVHSGRHGKRSSDWSKYMESGVLDVGFYGEDVPRITESIANFRDPNWIEKVWDHWARHPLAKIAEWYNLEDSVFRLAAHLKDMSKGISVEDSVEEINRMFPNYRKLGRFADLLARVPLVGPYAKFRYNMGQNVIKQFQQAYKEINDPGPKIRAKGIGRMLKWAIILATPTILSDLSKRYFDVDEKLTRQLETYLPDYRRNGTFVYFRKKKGGKLYAIDISYLNPWGDYEKLVKGLFRGDIVGAVKSMDMFTHPLLDLLQIIVKQKDPRTSMPYDNFGKSLEAAFQLLFLPPSSPIPNLGGILKGHFGPGATRVIDPITGKETLKLNEGEGNWRPGVLTGAQFKAIYDAYNNNPTDMMRFKSLPEEVRNFLTGIRTFEVDPELLLYRAARLIVQEEIEIKKDYKNWIKNNATAPAWERDEHIKAMADRLNELAPRAVALKELAEKLKKTGFQAQHTRY